MIKNLTALDVKVGENLYRFTCDPSSPTPEVRHVLSMMIDKVDEIIKNAEASEKQKCCESGEECKEGCDE